MTSEASFIWVDPNDSASQAGVVLGGEEAKGVGENEEPEMAMDGHHASSDIDTLLSHNVNKHLGGLGVITSTPESVDDELLEANEPSTPEKSVSERSESVTPPLSVENATKLMAAKITGDLELAVKGVWVPVLTNGAVSTEQGTIKDLDAASLTLLPMYLCDKLVGLMFGFSMENAGFGAADLVAWLLKEDAFSRQVKPSVLCGRLSDLVTDQKLEVIWASLRLLRNLSVRPEYGQAVFESIAHTSWTDPTSQIYLCEICTNLALSAKSKPDGSSSTLFKHIYENVIGHVFNLLTFLGLPKEDSGHVTGYVLSTLLALMCPTLLELFGTEESSGFQNYVWEALLGTDSQEIQESGLKVIQELVKSGQDRIMEISMRRMDNLFGLMGMGEAYSQKLALQVAHSVQMWNPKEFAKSVSADQIKNVARLQMILVNGTDEHKMICLAILKGLLKSDEDHASYYSCDPNIVSTLLCLLQSTSTDIVKGGLEALGLLGERDIEGEFTDQLAEPTVLAQIVLLIEQPDISRQKELYEIVASVAEKGGRAALHEAGMIQCLCTLLGFKSEGISVLVLPCLLATLGDDQESIEFAVKLGLIENVATILMDEIRPDALQLLIILLQSKSESSSKTTPKFLDLVPVLLDSVENRSVDAALVLCCVAAIIRSSPEMQYAEAWVSGKNILLFNNYLRHGDMAIKAQVLCIISTSVKPLDSGGEPLFDLLCGACHVLPEFTERHDVLSTILQIIADFGEMQPEAIANCLLQPPSVVKHVYEAVIEIGMPSHNVKPLMKVLSYARQLEQQKCEQIAREEIENLKLQQAQGSEHLNIQIRELKERLEQSLLEPQPVPIPEPSTAYVWELEDLKRDLETQKQDLIEAEEAYEECQGRYAAEVKKVKVLTELVEQQHDRLSVLNAALNE